MTRPGVASKSRCSPRAASRAQAVERVPDVGVARCRAARRRAGSRRARGSRAPRPRARSARGSAATPRGWASATCEPRRAGSRGVASAKPSGASHASCSAIIRSVSAIAFACSAAIPASAVSRTPSSTAARPRIGGVPARKRRIDGVGVVAALHRELVALAEPAPDRRAQRRLALARHVEVAGRARPGVEVLVGAADGELGAGGAQADRDRARRVAEVPDQRRAALGRRGLERRQVGERAGAVADVREDDDVARPARERRRVGLAVELAQRERRAAAAIPSSTWRSVGKLPRSVTSAPPPRRRAPTSLNRLTVVESQTSDLAGLGADHRRERVAGALGRVDPVRPAADEPLAPLAGGRGEPRRASRPAAGRASCRRGRGRRRRPRRSGRGSRASGSAASAASAAARLSGSATPSPPSTAGSRGSRWPKWSSPGATTSSTSSPAARAAAANASLIASGTMSSRSPCVSSAGTPSGSRSAGDAARSAPAAPPACRRAARARRRR